MFAYKRVFDECERPIFNTATKKPSWVFVLLVIFTTAVILSLQVTRNLVVPPKRASDREVLSGPDGPSSCSGFFSSAALPRRAVVKSISEFGGVGDGRTSNTAAFKRAVDYMERRKGPGGSQLNVPRGRWVTGSFNLTSNFTLFLEDGAVILGSQVSVITRQENVMIKFDRMYFGSKDPEEWPIIEPLPSYGRGRERAGGRHISLIHGNALSNVVITGNNGSIDGQGKMWWDMWWNKTLDHTRGHLLELINSTNVLISNLTFLNSPFWTIHPVYCSNVVIRNMTILAPLNAPNTDGVDPDSSTNVCIEDCYIESGDDLVAVKSGWDQYGISMAKPSVNITIRRVSGTTPTCSGIGIGSEMSGGISNVLVEDMYIRDSAAGVRIKTDEGRGGYMRNITIRNIKMERVKVPIRFSRGANDHPDEKWDREALPEVRGITISDVVSLDSRKAPQLVGIKGTMFTDICLKNVSILGLFPSMKWSCEFVSGFSEGVTPMPCLELQKHGSSSWCS